MESKLERLLLLWVVIIVLLVLFLTSCVQKVVPVSSKQIPVTTIVVKPDSTRTYNTIFVKYFDSVAIYLKTPKQKSQ
jgi:PBP1b-binding outer membrane lipoprotein LpoB